MPLKIGKSKSSSGSELVQVQNTTSDESSTHHKKNKGFRKFLDRAKLSKIPTPRPPEETSAKSKEKVIDALISRNTNSPISNLVNPKLYTNCDSSTEELSSVTSNTNINSTPQSSITCSPIEKVIIEEDYEDALPVNNRTQKITNSVIDSKSIPSNPSLHNKKVNQSIYNEPGDAVHSNGKEIIESCRLSQITPTNQLKEIRSRSGSDTDSLMVHPDVGVGSRCSTNSSSVGSAQTLSESPAVAPNSSSNNAVGPGNSSNTASPLPTVTGNSVLSVDTSNTAVPLPSYQHQQPQHMQHSSHAPSSDLYVPSDSTTAATTFNVQQSHPVQHTTTTASSISSLPSSTTPYVNSPKGNTVICHHPASPFSPPNSGVSISSSVTQPKSLPVLSSTSTAILSSLPTVTTADSSSYQKNLPINSSISSENGCAKTILTDTSSVGINNTNNTNNSSNNFISRRPGRLNKSNTATSIDCSANCTYVSSRTPPGVLLNANEPQSHMHPVSNNKHLEMRSDSYHKQQQQPQPLYEEAWDLKIQKLCIDIAVDKYRRTGIAEVAPVTSSTSISSGNNGAAVSAAPTIGTSQIMMVQRPQSAVGGRRHRTDSPSSKFASPPAVPPHRRRSAHLKSTTQFSSFDDTNNNAAPSSYTSNSASSTACSSSCNVSANNTTKSSTSTGTATTNATNNIISGNSNSSNSVTSNSTSNNSNSNSLFENSRLLFHKSNLKHNINPSFEPQTNCSDYDYAYNDTWSMGVQMNMSRNLNSNGEDRSTRNIKDRSCTKANDNNNNGTNSNLLNSNMISGTGSGISGGSNIIGPSYLDKIDSVEDSAESSPGDSSSSVEGPLILVPSSNCDDSNSIPVSVANPAMNCSSNMNSNSGIVGNNHSSATVTTNSSGVNPVLGMDTDTLSNDSYEEPWDVRHGRVISELTSTRLIDPACVLAVNGLSSGVSTTNTSMVATSNSTARISGAQPINSSSTSAQNFSPSMHHQQWHSAAQSSRINTTANGGSTNPSPLSHPQHAPRNRQRSVSGSRQNNSIPIINTSILLEEQPWYHHECSRSRAEGLLLSAREGSFLVRKSETCRNSFSLTIKHRNEYLHMKISHDQSRGFILGQYSQPYVSIPHMLHHYSLTMVPVRGADSVQLTHPVIRR